jgi:hypothetical protein
MKVPLESLEENKYPPPSQIIRHSNFLEESKHLEFDQNYRENYKDL